MKAYIATIYALLSPTIHLLGEEAQTKKVTLRIVRDFPCRIEDTKTFFTLKAETIVRDAKPADGAFIASINGTTVRIPAHAAQVVDPVVVARQQRRDEELFKSVESGKRMIVARTGVVKNDLGQDVVLTEGEKYYVALYDAALGAYLFPKSRKRGSDPALLIVPRDMVRVDPLAQFEKALPKGETSRPKKSSRLDDMESELDELRSRLEELESK